MTLYEIVNRLEKLRERIDSDTTNLNVEDPTSMKKLLDSISEWDDNISDASIRLSTLAEKPPLLTDDDRRFLRELIATYPVQGNKQTLGPVLAQMDAILKKLVIPPPEEM